MRQSERAAFIKAARHNPTRGVMDDWYVKIVRAVNGAALPDKTQHEFADEYEAKAFARSQIKRGFDVTAGRVDGRSVIATAPELIKWLTLTAEELRRSLAHGP